MVREQIPDLKLKSLCPVGGEWLWDEVLTHCYMFGCLRFAFNPVLEVSGTAEDTNVQYVNSPKFVFCVAIELLNYHYLKPAGLFIQALNNICSRN